mgnify:CR=1 FL=1
MTIGLEGIGLQRSSIAAAARVLLLASVSLSLMVLPPLARIAAAAAWPNGHMRTVKRCACHYRKWLFTQAGCFCGVVCYITSMAVPIIGGNSYSHYGRLYYAHSYLAGCVILSIEKEERILLRYTNLHRTMHLLGR